MNILEQIIRKQLKEATDHCQFKHEWIPVMLDKGWACVNIDQFAKELADEIIKQGKLVKEAK